MPNYGYCVLRATLLAERTMAMVALREATGADLPEHRAVVAVTCTALDRVELMGNGMGRFVLVLCPEGGKAEEQAHILCPLEALPGAIRLCFDALLRAGMNHAVNAIRGYLGRSLH